MDDASYCETRLNGLSPDGSGLMDEARLGTAVVDDDGITWIGNLTT